MHNAHDTKSVDLVLEGGGVKGIGLAGAFEALDRHGFRPENIAGTSAGRDDDPDVIYFPAQLAVVFEGGPPVVDALEELLSGVRGVVDRFAAEWPATP